MIVQIREDVAFKPDAVSLAVAAEVKAALTWPNPAWDAAQRRGRWTGAIPETISAWDFDRAAGLVRIPRGALGLLRAAAARRGVELEICDDRAEARAYLWFAPGVSLRAYQVAAVGAMVQAETGVVCMPCGGGKTFTGLLALARVGQRALVLVHTTDLQDQWVGAARSVLGVEAACIGGGRPSKAAALAVAAAPIVVATVQTLARQLESDPSATRELLAGFGAVVVDEAHHTPARTFAEVAHACPARYRWGLTATPDRDDGLTPLMLASLGPICYRIGYPDLIADGYLIAPRIERRDTAFRYEWHERDEKRRASNLRRRDWGTCAAAIAADVERADQVMQDAEGLASAGHTVLILTGRKDHAALMAGMMYRQAEVLTSDTPKPERRRMLADFRDGRLRILIATQLADEGLDVPRLDRVLLAFPSRSARAAIQRLGRIMRPCPEAGKTDAVLIDYVDPGVTKTIRKKDGADRPLPLALFQYAARRRAYRDALRGLGVEGRR